MLRRLCLLLAVLLLVPLGCGGGGGLADGGRPTTPEFGSSVNLRILVQVPPSGRDALAQSGSSATVRIEVLERQSGLPVVSPVDAVLPSGSSQVEVPVLGVPAGFWRVSARLLSDGVPASEASIVDVEVVAGQTTRVALSLSNVQVTREFVVVANAGDDTLSVFQADLATSALTPVSGSPFSTGAGTSPAEVAFDPQGDFFYVSFEATDHVAQYRLDPVTGVPTFVNQVAAGNNPRGLAMDPLGRYLYVTNLFEPKVSGYSIDSATGSLTELAGSPFLVNGAQVPQTGYVEPQGRFLYVGEGNLISQMYAFRIDADSGNLAQVGGAISAGPPSNRIFGFQAPPAGDLLYVTGSFSQILGFDINPSTGAVTPKAGFPVNTPGTALGGMQLDDSRKVLHVTAFFEKTVLSYPLAAGGSLGALLPGTPIGTGGNTPLYLVLNPTNEALYVANVDQTGNPSAGSVAAYRIGSGGAPAAVSGSPFASGAISFGIDVVRYTR